MTTAHHRLCPGTGQPAIAKPASVYPYCPVCDRAFAVAGTRRSTTNLRKGNPWQTGIPRHYVPSIEARA